MSEKVSDLVEKFCSSRPGSDALSLLREGLPSDILYHTIGHTADVLSEVITFALHDRLSDADINLLAVAALFHDTGFVQSRKNNEEIGAKFAAEYMLKVGGFSTEQIALVGNLIMDTKVITVNGLPKQIPSSPLSNYLLDADLSNLGRDDFFEKADLVRQEIGVQDKRSYYEGVLLFLKAHKWYSPAAQALRETKKQDNILELAKRLRQ